MHSPDHIHRTCRLIGARGVDNPADNVLDHAPDFMVGAFCEGGKDFGQRGEKPPLVIRKAVAARRLAMVLIPLQKSATRQHRTSLKLQCGRSV
jgi:hypothetical protein